MATAGKDTLTVAALAALVALALVARAPAQTTDSDSVNLDPTDPTYGKQCVRENKPGLCLNATKCFENGTIERGGEIIDSILRSLPNPLTSKEEPLTKCGQGQWCCFIPETTPSSKPPIPTLPSQGGSCSRVVDKCSWCVALYRDEGDEARGQRTASGLYCGGALVGPRVVLTSAMCVRAVQRETVHARLPLGDRPDIYTVVKSVVHPKYNSGTHENDFALMILNEDVKWNTGIRGMACMQYSAPQGKCQIVGFSPNEEIVMTAATVRAGPCRSERGGGRGDELACATATDRARHSSASGMPLLCPITKDGQPGLAIMGVTRMPYDDGKVLFGKVETHSAWLTQELKAQGVEPHLYSP